MNRYIKYIFLLVLSVLGFNQIKAVPAYPGVQKFVQPDGYVLNVLTVGDEMFYYTQTTDGYLLFLEDGAFYYANVGTNGELVSTGVLARNSKDRTKEENDMLVNLNEDINVRPVMARRSYADRKSSSISTFPCVGKQKGLVVLVDFPDKAFTLSDPVSEFNDMLNKVGYDKYNGTGSAFDFFYDSSYGQFEPEFDIYGPLTMSKEYSEYGKNGTNGAIDLGALDMVTETCQQLYEQGVNLKDYDRDNDGIVDNVYIFYAGKGEADNTGQPDLIWPHSSSYENWFQEPLKLGDVYIQKYACSNELNSNGVMCGIGTFCHEFSHVLGLPDLYMTENKSEVAFTPGTWSALDRGPYNNDGRTPPAFSVYERYALGWIEPVELNSPKSVVLNEISSKEAYIIRTEQEDEYFLLENRQQEGWDTYIPGHGMLVWHIDYKKSLWDANIVNNNAAHQYVDLEEADNSKTETSRAGDAFPGTKGVKSFTDNTRPAMRDWSNKKLEKPITNIEEKDGVIYFDFMGGGGLGIGSLSDGCQYDVYSSDNSIVVENNASESVYVKVYNVQGVEVGGCKCIDKASISVCPGLYVVVVDNSCSKVLVK